MGKKQLSLLAASVACMFVMALCLVQVNTLKIADDDCKYINTHLDDYCKDTSNWGGMTGCDVSSTGVDLSLSWCPKVIRNRTCVEHVKLHMNHLKASHGHQFDKGNVRVAAYKHGSSAPAFDNSFPETCQDIMKYFSGLPDLVKKHLKCPFQFPKFIPKFILKYTVTVPNPLSESLPQGSYHVLANITNSNNQKFLCLDTQMEFGQYK